MKDIIYIYLIINCIIAYITKGIKTDGYYTKTTIIGGTILIILFGLPIGIICYIYVTIQNKIEKTL